MGHPALWGTPPAGGLPPPPARTPAQPGGDFLGEEKSIFSRSKLVPRDPWLPTSPLHAGHGSVAAWAANSTGERENLAGPGPRRGSRHVCAHTGHGMTDRQTGRAAGGGNAAAAAGRTLGSQDSGVLGPTLPQTLPLLGSSPDTSWSLNWVPAPRVRGLSRPLWGPVLALP